MIQTTQGGQTLYLGRQISDQYARLYDKGSESGQAEYDGCWRYEVVRRDHYAKAALQALLACPDEKPLVTRSVWDYFNDRGIAPRFDAAVTPASLAAPRAVPDVERWRSWFRRSVRPGVAARLAGMTFRERQQFLDPTPPTRQELLDWADDLVDEHDDAREV